MPDGVKEFPEDEVIAFLQADATQRDGSVQEKWLLWDPGGCPPCPFLSPEP